MRDALSGTSSVIEVRGLVKRYGSPTQPNAVDGIDFAVADGERFGLLGPNGAGKTTTVGVATTRVKPTRGTALVCGLDVTADPAMVKRSIGVVSQSNTLDRSCTAFENVYFHCRFFGIGRRAAVERTNQLLADFKLAERAKAMVSELSGGMARRLQIARAIAHRPRVLFLDEPTTGLDPQSRLVLWEILAELRHREGLTVLLTTHYMEEADQFCDRVAIIDHGRILVCDSPAALKRSVGASTVIELRLDGPANDLPATLLRLPGVQAAHSTVDGVQVLTENDGQVMPRIVAAAGHDLRDVSVITPTLETVFLTLTGRELRE
ncbi:MAG: ATP-binding cassette domain-containing protein [Egibacteraceae bacterium]